MTHRRIGLALTVLALAALGAPPSEAATKTFLETNQEDFAEGKADGVVWTSLGTLRLGRALDSLLDETKGVDYVAKIAEAPDGALFAVTGGAGRVYRIDGDKVALYATLPDKFLFSCAAGPDGVLYVGSGGTKGRLWRLTPRKEGEPKQEVLFEDEKVKYIWDLVCLPDGALAAATGDEGKLLRINRDGKSEVLLDSEEKHLLCLALAPDGALYAGSDGAGLVYRWADKKAFLLYDADEPEITGLALDADGNLYAGASSGTGGRGGGAEIPAGTTTIRILPVPERGPEDAFSTDERNVPPGKKLPKAAPEQDPSGEPESKSADVSGEAPSETPPAPQPIQSLAEKLQEAMLAARRTAAKISVGGPGGGVGNRVYRITPRGIVTPIFEGPDQMILALAVAGGRLLVATGRKAHIYEVALAGEPEDACVAGMDPKQAMALAVTRGGRVVVGTASPGRLYGLSKGFAREGTFTSQVHDAGGSATWGALDWIARTPAGAQVRLAMRTGNVGDPEKGLWSDWSKDLGASPAAIPSPAGRYIQFRVTMQTRDDAVTPTLEQFEAAYLRANEPPRIASVGEQAPLPARRDVQAQAMERLRQTMQARARSSGDSTPPPQPQPAQPQGPQPVRLLVWQATDPNGDRLTFDLYFRGQGEPTWIRLEKNLVQPQFPWDTSTVADGWYEIKVVASDRLDNPADAALEDARVSDPILIDNTPPLIEKVGTEVRGGEVTVRFVVRDATSWITEAAYAVDSAEDWHAVGPADGLFDSPREEIRFVVRDLAKGPHRLAIRASDKAGNIARAAATVTVKE
ncbi:MAG: WD40 repeat domain-containing protein [Planctomycetota bacterium]|nr:WD40 repeat domain-containing protein [Planctomycetota bacterium]